MPRARFVMQDGTVRELMAVPDESVLALAHRENIPLEGACGGALACATCHVHVASEWLPRLPAMSEDEADMLDLAKNVRKNSRLGCQILLTEALDGITFTLP